MYRKLAIVLALGLLLAASGAAYAEGYWRSYISMASTGFDSRTWEKRLDDNNKTTVAFTNCTEHSAPYLSGENATVQLTRERSLLPDQNKGQRTLYCYHSRALGDYGVQGTGNYHFTIVQINGVTFGHQIDVEYVEVRY